ncbi:ERL2, partial [Symbiodinium sp. CCMP2456]
MQEGGRSEVLVSNVNDCNSAKVCLDLLQQYVSQGERDGANLKAALQKLGVADDEMHGDDHCEWAGIYCVESGHCVEFVELRNTNLTGRLSVELGKLTRLTHMWLGENPQLSGNLGTLSALADLVLLDLRNTKVTGEINALKNSRKLQRVNLFHTKVYGKLEALSNLVELKELDLSRTGITGRFEILKNFDHMTKIMLAETQTSGQLKELTDLRELSHLDLSKTNTTGAIEDLLGWKHLREVSLRNTGVTGRLSAKWLGMLKELSALDLAVRHPGRFRADDRGCTGSLKPEVSGCPLNAMVEDFVWSLAQSDRLAKVTAARCNLTGTLPYFDEHALSVSLQTLDLSENRITYVQGLVAGGLLSLANNPSISFAPGVLANAIHRMVRIDLRGVRVTEAQVDNETTKLLAKLRGETLVQIDNGRLQCHKLSGTVLDVTPGRFLSDQFCSPSPGHARLAATDVTGHQCFFPAKERCNSTNSRSEWKQLGCAEGYEGVLCSICGDGFRSSAGRCKRCTEDLEQLRRWLAGAALLVALVAAGLYVSWRNWSKRLPESQEPKPMDALIPLLLGQGPVLLQFVQLWALLAALGPTKTAYEADEQLVQEELSRWLELTAAGIADGISVQCIYGRLAVSFSAFASPSLPLCLLMLCLLVEVLDWSGKAFWRGRGLGVDLALKVLLFLFIGGAASCEKLLRCQDVDAGGEELGGYAYRYALPHLRCSDFTSDQAVWAAYVGYGSAVAYGLLVPSFLIYLIVKQNVALAPNRRCVSWAEVDEHEKVTVRASLLEFARKDGKTDEEGSHLQTGPFAMSSGSSTGFGNEGATNLVAGTGVGYHHCVRESSFDWPCTGGPRLTQLMSPLESRSVSLAFVCNLEDNGLDLLAFGSLGKFAETSLMLQPRVLCSGICICKALAQGLIRVKLTRSKAGKFHNRFAQGASPGHLQSTVPYHAQDSQRQKKIVSDNLLAAAIAYSAVFLGGHRVHIVQDDKAESLSLGQHRCWKERASTKEGLTVWNLMPPGCGQVGSSFVQPPISQCYPMHGQFARMLAEHEMLEEKAQSDRILAGAKTIFFKYAACEDVWVEALLKVVAVALVTTVSVKSLLLTLFITVGMAILLGAQKPYQQRQVNDLQSGCFLCLSVAAVSLKKGSFQIARSVLVIPFLAACVQMLRPGTSELSGGSFGRAPLEHDSRLPGHGPRLEAYYDLPAIFSFFSGKFLDFVNSFSFALQQVIFKMDERSSVPAWDGSARSWRRYTREVAWYVQGTPVHKRRHCASKLLSRLSGPARTLAMSWNRMSFDQPGGTKHYLQKLAASPLVRKTLPNAAAICSQYFSFQRKPGENISSFLVRESLVHEEFSEAIIRLHEDKLGVSQEKRDFGLPSEDAEDWSS